MMATTNAGEACSKEGTETAYLDVISMDDVELNIAIVGEIGSGRSSFVNAIRGLKENDENAAKPGERTAEELSFFTPPEYSNIHFFILPSIGSIDDTTLSRLEIEKFHIFLILTATSFEERHVMFAKKIKDSKKPLFFIRTKIDNDHHSDNEEKMLKDLKRSLVEKLGKLEFGGYEIYLISNHHTDKWDFGRLVRAVADSLPSPQKECLNKIPITGGLIALEKFQKFIEEEETKTNIFRRFFDNVSDVKQKLTKTGIAGIQRLMKDRLERWKEVKIDIAILGNSGVGKSSFINAIRGLPNKHPLAANTGSAGEVTTVPTPFKHPTNENIIFWDLPGIGTPKYPDMKTFCDKVSIKKYDTFLIISATRFTENDRLLAMEVKSMEKSFFFIRTKIDQDVESAKDDSDYVDEETTLKTIKKKTVEKLQDFNFDKDTIFLISSRKRTKYDFERLKQAILDQLPSKQKESLILSIRVHSKRDLTEKIKLLKDRVWMTAILSVVSTFGLGLFSLLVDPQLIKSKVKFYRSQLSFPENGSEEFTMLTEDLQKKVTHFHLEPDQEMLPWLKSFDRDNKYNIRMWGPLMISKRPLKLVDEFLKQILDEMEIVASEILDQSSTIA